MVDNMSSRNLLEQAPWYRRANQPSPSVPRFCAQRLLTSPHFLKLKGHVAALSCIRIIQTNGNASIFILSGDCTGTLVLHWFKSIEGLQRMIREPDDEPEGSRRMQTFRGIHQASITSIVPLKNSLCFYTSGGDGRILQWNLSENPRNEEEPLLKAAKLFQTHDAYISSCSMNKDETVMVSSSLDGTIKLTGVQHSSTLEFRLPCSCTYACFYPGSLSILITSEQGNENISFWNINSQSIPTGVHQLSDSGLKKLRIGDGLRACNQDLFEDDLCTKSKFNSFTKQYEKPFQRHRYGTTIETLTMILDGRFMVTSGTDHCQKLWSTFNRTGLHSFDDSTASPVPSPCHRYLFLGTIDGSLRLVDLYHYATTLVEIPQAHHYPIAFMAQSLDGTILVTGDDAGQLQLRTAY